MNPLPKIYMCHEPDEGPIAAHLTGWPRTNNDLSLYDARLRIPVSSIEAESIKVRLVAQMLEAEVFVCLISQATCFDEWVTWEIRAARSRSHPPGMIGIILHESDIRPPSMVDAGAIFIPFQRDKVERAIEWAVKHRGKSGDFKFIDE